MKKESLLHALAEFARQRPGMDPDIYGDWRTYRRESAGVTADLAHFRELLAAVSWRDSITAADILEAARGAYSGRLSIEEEPDGSARISYCTGQYFQTEYRRAACAVLASALWAYWRETIQPTGYRVTCEDDSHARTLATSRKFTSREDAEAYARTVASSRHPAVSAVYAGGLSAGDYLRKMARREFSRAIAARYFN